MDQTKEKLLKIIEEINSANESISGINSDLKTTEQVVNILLKNSSQGPTTVNDVTGSKISSPFDMGELTKWKNLNNQRFQINYYRTIYSHRKYIGSMIVFAKKAIRKIIKFLIEPIIEEQNEFNRTITASVNALYNNDVVTQEFIKSGYQYIEQTKGRIGQISQAIEKLTSDIGELTTEIGELTTEIGNISLIANDLDNVKKMVEEIYGLRELPDEFSEIKSNLNTIEQSIIKNQDSIHAFDFKIDNVERSFVKALNNRTSGEDATAGTDLKLHWAENVQSNVPVDQRIYHDIDYFDFENHFRGTRADIKKSQEIYLEYFLGESDVVDLGCGRGEFLELLQENRVKAAGIDICDEFIQYCQIKGLNVIKNDAVSYMKNLSDNTIGGVFAAQFVEHINTSDLIEICEETYKKLKPGGYFVIETPNPRCLSIYTNAFYVDPSHNKPVHPQTLEYLLKKAGFQDVRICFTEQSKVAYSLPLLDAENINNLEQFNNGLNVVSDILFGSQDYAIIAQK
jgi:O-antigen chain-terminating methyltransferase